MEMIVHLHPEVFDIVLQGKKNVEVRVNDEKRRKIKVGDKITFLKRPDDIENIDAIVENLSYYKNFKDLVKDYTIEELYSKGYSKEEFLYLLKRFYSDDEIDKYGTVAIKFKIT